MKCTMTVLIAVLLGSAASAQSITGCSKGECLVTTTATPNPWYSYEPKGDITVQELSEVVTVLLPALSCRHYFDDCGVVKKIDGLQPNVKRHFVRHEN